MGFFKNIFKKKKGGTFLGNLVRGVSSSATGGILGSGAGLAKWEAEQAQKEQDAMVAQQVQNSSAYKVGTAVGLQAKPYVDAVKNSEEVADAKKSMILDWLKTNWIKLLIPIVLLTLLVVWLIRRNKNGNQSGGTRYKKAK
ncbi:structural protein [Cellulophaga phage phi18:4]|nr:structural protein [Cellulophaga phage phi18:4]AGO49405.1 structural protein [Cellulophaga phage phi48:1]